MKKLLFVCSLCFLFLPGFSQKLSDFEEVALAYEGMKKSDISTISALGASIASYSPDAEKRYALLYYWMTHEISYDVSLMLLSQPYKSPEDAIQKTFLTRKGICQGYVELTHALCEPLGISSHIITGYTRQDGELNPLPHSWLGIRIQDRWMMSDPTWGAGYVKDKIFTAMFNENWFLLTPEQAIQHHMPFDPLWQLLSSPVLYDGFDRGDTLFLKSGNELPEDSILLYKHSSRKQQIEGTSRRIERNGTKNVLVQKHLEQILAEKDVLEQNQVIYQFNDAVELFNKGITFFNTYVQYKNKHFQPAKSEKETRLLATDALESLESAHKKIAGLRSEEQGLNDTIVKLNRNIEIALERVKKEMEFIDTYFGTPESQRKLMFVSKKQVRTIKKR